MKKGQFDHITSKLISKAEAQDIEIMEKETDAFAEKKKAEFYIVVNRDDLDDYIDEIPHIEIYNCENGDIWMRVELPGDISEVQKIDDIQLFITHPPNSFPMLRIVRVPAAENVE